ncbi:MAG: hypothetical protein IH984_10805 [Planctomycetes bacterium]|nr:hypothetical protein [Planctomycetota bacterium]
MVTRKTKQSLIAAVTFAILPLLVIIKSAGTLFGSGPEIARASYETLPFIVPDDAGNDELSLTDQQSQAVDYIAILQSKQFGPSPLHRGAKTIIGDKNPFPPPKLPSLQITVQMIMSSSAGNTVLIDGKPYKVGQKLKDSAWIVSEIDGEARSVTVENKRTGQSMVFVVQTPG